MKSNTVDWSRVTEQDRSDRVHPKRYRATSLPQVFRKLRYYSLVKSVNNLWFCATASLFLSLSTHQNQQNRCCSLKVSYSTMDTLFKNTYIQPDPGKPSSNAIWDRLILWSYLKHITRILSTNYGPLLWGFQAAALDTSISTCNRRVVNHFQPDVAPVLQS